MKYINLISLPYLICFFNIFVVSNVIADVIDDETLIITSDATKMFSEIQRHVSSIKQLDLKKSKNEIPGIYSAHGPTNLERFGVEGGTSGSLFYIFPDGTYIYTEWADIMPETIYEKGHWKISDSFISFMNDDSLSKERSTSDNYLPIRLENGNIIIIGNKWDYHYFSTHYFDHSDPLFMLLLTSHEKEKKITLSKTESLKTELMERAWKPWFFAEGFPPHQLKVDAYAGSDVVAIIQSIFARAIPLEDGGGAEIRAKVISPIKGKVSAGDVLELSGGAVNIYQKYIANLVWDSKTGKYDYFDWNMVIPVEEFNNYDDKKIEVLMGAWGLTGKAVPYKGKYYIPFCYAKCDPKCQRKFEYVQYMFSQQNN